MSGLSFTGDLRRKNINLGGQQRDRVDLIQKAKQQREERELERLKTNARQAIQTFVLSKQSAYHTRTEQRAAFDAVLALPAPQIDSASLLHATRLLAFFWVDGNAQDIKRAAKWCRFILVPMSGGSKTPILFSMFDPTKPETGNSWAVLVRRLSGILLQQASFHPSLPQAPLFLEITKMLCDPAVYAKWGVTQKTLSQTSNGETPLQYLLQRKLYETLQHLILSIPATNRAHPTLSPAIHLTLLPFKAFPPPQAPSTLPAPPESTAALNAFISQILTIPLLTARIPPASLTTLSNSLPLNSLLLLPVTSPAFATLIQTPEKSIHLLGNLLVFVNGQAGGMKFDSGKILGGYLSLMSEILDEIPKSWFVVKGKEKEKEVKVDVKGKGKEEVIIIDDDDSDVEVPTLPITKDADGDIAMAPSQSTSKYSPLDSQTLANLSLLSSRSHLISLLTHSTKFSASTRPQLSNFLVSLLSTLPHSISDSILNTVMYGSSGGAGAAGERGGGLLREIWRGYIRSSELGRILSASPSDEEKVNIVFLVTNSFTNPKYTKSDWSSLILLTQLYSKCLLTLGDDEFFTQGKNPLMVEEVVGLSGILRNLCFALYWNVGVRPEGEKGVGGTRLREEGLRELVTGLVQQIHARDSRRQFTPKNHWLMTSQFDLSSFIQTAVYEDEQLDAEGGDEAPAPTGRHSIWDNDSGGEEEEDAFVRRRRAPIASRAATLSKRQLAFVSPRLGVLNNIPFVIPFETRVAIFRQLVANDRQRLGIERDRYDRRKRHRAVVRRTHLAEDSFKQLNGLGASLKSTIEIAFIDEHGMEESGIDGGGLFKELLTSLSKEAFDTDRGLWLATTEQELYPNPHSYARDPAQLQWYAFIGRILGKALYEGILVDVRFAGFFLSKWLGRQSYLDDLASLDPELYNGLIFLKNYSGDVEADLSLNFTVSEDDFGVSRTISLVRNGAETAVTKENRMQYIFLMAHYRLNGQIAKQCEAFFSGLSEIIPARFLRLFNQSELRELVGGVDQAVDLEDLRLNTVYGGWDGDEVNDTIRDFWEVVATFDKEQRANLVQFVTACKRPPLLGFGQLNPRFAIRNAGSDLERLPTSSTCVNLLKMPAYKDKASLKSKLLYAINAQAGFDLS